MKTKTWALLLCALFLICLALSILFFRPTQAVSAEVWSEGKRIKTLDLSVDQTLTVESSYGTNTVTVRGGKISVTEASCPDGYCMQRGRRGGGAQIVCLPNRLVIRFTAQAELDGIAG